MSSWALVRTGKAFAASGAVENLKWDFPELTGVVLDNAVRLAVRVDFRSQALPANHCECPAGKQRRFCAHALALYFQYWQSPPPEPPPLQPPPVSAQERRSPVPSRQHVAAFSVRVDGSPQYLAIRVPSGSDLIRATVLDHLKRHGFQPDFNNGTWWLRDKHRVLSFLAAHGTELSGAWHAQFTPGFLQRTACISTAKLAAEATTTGNGKHAFCARIEAGKAVSEEELRIALARGQNYVETSSGKIVLLPPALLAAAVELTRRLHAENTDAALSPHMECVVGAAELAGIENTLENLAIPFTPPQAWRERSMALRNPGTLLPVPASPALQNCLRPYQQIGAAWLWHLYQLRLGGVLADEMGLGKTVQALAFLDALGNKENNEDGQNKRGVPLGEKTEAAKAGTLSRAPSLVVCPAALVENWCREAARFAPSVAIYRHHGTSRARNADALPPAGVVVTSYGTLNRDIALFRECPWQVIIADEAQHIKNRRSQNAKSLRTLHAAGRFVLTGTPVENSLEDLRSLFAFLMPGYLPKPPPGTVFRDDRLHLDDIIREKTAPYILRRTKRAVAPELPEKVEQTIYCELESAQAALYKEWQERSRAEIFEMEMGGAAEGHVRMAAFSHLLRLRQICAEPRLLSPELTANDSAKWRALQEILDEAVDGGHRLLVFSQFVEVLRHLSHELTASGVSYCYMDGATRDRQAECDRFNASTSIPVFLISLKAGGTGLNLTGADTVVHFDPWWNPATEAQATDRTHRIGQTRTVTSLKLIAAGTVEERVLELQRSKAGLLRDLFAGNNETSMVPEMAELKALLE
jgi:superfamily II DNA or RNA helicase